MARRHGADSLRQDSRLIPSVFSKPQQLGITRTYSLISDWPDARGYGSWAAKQEQSIQINSMYLLLQLLDPRFPAAKARERPIWRRTFGATARDAAPDSMGGA